MRGFSDGADWTSWGRVVRRPHRVARPAWLDEIPALVSTAAADGLTVLPTGRGRSYGETCLNPDGAVVDMTGVGRLMALDTERRTLRADAGASLDDILQVIVPRGLFLPVTPGTRLVTLGGAIANDVHGKNHHGAGTFGRWIRRLGLLRSDGSVLELGPDDATGLFAATIGGLGLTGVIVWAEIALIPIASAMMDVETVPFSGLDGFFTLAAESENTFDYTVSWVDCLAGGADFGRGIFTRARHAPTGPLAAGRSGGPSLPLDLPAFVLNTASIRAFNALYAWNGRRKAGTARTHYQPYFYPLDAIGGWNRMYGRRGLYQYQSVVPAPVARDATKAMLEAISAAGQGSFLAVLKTFGDLTSPGLLSFPMAGTTLALDFPNRGPETLALMSRLDAIVREAGGRLYPAKDGRVPRDMFLSSYPALDRFKPHIDPRFSSLFWRRVAP